MQRRWWRLILAAVLVGADEASKAWASHALSGRGTVWLWRPWLSLQLLYNPGATLGMGADHARAITVFSALAVAAFVVLVWRVERGGTGLTLLLGGAAGNLASRLAHGAVTDFVHLWFWPGIFNLADVFLRLGALLAVVAFTLGGAQATDRQQAALDPTAPTWPRALRSTAQHRRLPPHPGGRA